MRLHCDLGGVRQLQMFLRYDLRCPGHYRMRLHCDLGDARQLCMHLHYDLGCVRGRKFFKYILERYILDLQDFIEILEIDNYRGKLFPEFL